MQDQGELKVDLSSIAEALGCGSAALAEGATNEEIAQLAQCYAGDPPAEVVHNYRERNGEVQDVRLFCGYRFLSVEEVVREVAIWDEVQAGEAKYGEGYREPIPSYPALAVKDLVHCSAWVPFASGYGGAQLAVDLDPGSHGTYGQVINFGPDDLYHFVLAHSFGEFLAIVHHRYLRKQWHPDFEGEAWSLYDEMIRTRSRPAG